MTEDNFEPSIVPIFPGISPKAAHHLSKGLPYDLYPWTYTPRQSYLTLLRNKIKRQEKMMPLLQKKVDTTHINWKLGDGGKVVDDLTLMENRNLKKLRRIKKLEKDVHFRAEELAKQQKVKEELSSMKAISHKSQGGKYIPKFVTEGWKTAPNGDMYDPKVFKWDAERGMIQPKNTWWNKTGKLANKVFKNPILKGAGKLTALGGLPLLLAGELDYSEGNWKNLFMPDYEYTPVRGSTVWEDING